jgi:hypothetical protein
MKVSFLTTLFYIASTTPEFCEYLSLPILKPVEAQAWSTVLLTSGLVYGSYSDRWVKQKKALKEINQEKKSE